MCFLAHTGNGVTVRGSCCPQAKQLAASCLCSGLGRGVCSAAAGRRWRCLEASPGPLNGPEIGQATILWVRDAHTCARTQAEPSGTKAEPNRRKLVLCCPGHDFVDVSYSHTADGTKRNQGGTNVKGRVCVGQARTSVTRALATPSFNQNSKEKTVSAFLWTCL